MRIEEMLKKGDGVRLGPGMSRRDFLKIVGTGMAGTAMLTVPGCGVFGGSGGGGGGGGGGSSKSVAINLEQTIRDLDSVKTTDSVSTEILLNVMAGLYRLDANARPVADMAESVEISEDKLDYTFTIRDGVTWSNGDPVTSNDFKFAWLRALDPKTASQYAYIITTFVKGAAEYNAGDGKASDVAVEAPDDKTLKVTLLAPAPYWLGLTSFFTYLPQNQKYVESKGEKYALSADALIYNGPYKLTEFNPTSGTVVVKNEDYWNADNVEMSKVDAKVVKETDTAVNLYESGQLDETIINSEFVTEYRGTPDLVTITQFATGWLEMNFDTVPLFNNKNFRKALQMGINSEAANNEILNNGSEAATGLVPPGMAGPGEQSFRDAEGPVMPAYDPDEAKKLFQKAVEEVGENPEFELLAEDSSVVRDIATLFQSDLKKMGAKVSVNLQPFSSRLELEANGDFQMVVTAWLGDYNDPMTFLDYFESTSTFNTFNYKNDRFDELISSAKTETDDAKRMDMLLEAEKLLVADDAAISPWRFYGQAYLVNPDVISKYVEQPYGGGKDYSLWKLA